MKTRTFFRTILFVELILFSYVMLLSEQGWRVVWHANHSVERLARKINRYKREIAHLTDELNAWQTESIKQEQVARCHLGLAREEEHIYYLHPEAY